MHKLCLGFERWPMVMAIAFLLISFSDAYADPIINGNFNMGLTGWSVQTNPSGDVTGIASHDIDGPSPLGASDAFFTQVRGGFGTSPVSLTQTVLLMGGTTYSFSANISSVSPVFNSSGGVVTALIGSTSIDSFNFGSIGDIATNTGASEFATLSATFTPGATGSYLFNVTFLRPFLSSSNTPINYIDNISLSDSSTAIPEPTTIILLAMGLGGLAAGRLHRKQG